MLHIESGLKFPITWRHYCPHLYEKQVEELRLANEIRQCKVSCFSTDLLKPAINALKKAKVCAARSDALKLYIQKRVAEFELEERRRNGHKQFLKECPECRSGMIRQRAHRRVEQRVRQVRRQQRRARHPKSRARRAPGA